MGRGNVWARLETGKRKREKEREKNGKSNFLWKHIVLLDLPGSVPRAQLKVNFSYCIPFRDIIT